MKVHSQLTRERTSPSRVAPRAGVVFGGHVPRVVGAAAASDSGQRSIEHMLAIPAPCTPAESIALQPRFTVQSAIGRCSSENLGRLYARFVRNRTWVTPTFVAAYEIAAWPQRALPGDPSRITADTLRRYSPESSRAGRIPAGGLVAGDVAKRLIRCRHAASGVHSSLGRTHRWKQPSRIRAARGARASSKRWDANDRDHSRGRSWAARYLAARDSLGASPRGSAPISSCSTPILSRTSGIHAALGRGRQWAAVRRCPAREVSAGASRGWRGTALAPMAGRR